MKILLIKMYDQHYSSAQRKIYSLKFHIRKEEKLKLYKTNESRKRGEKKGIN